MPTTAEELKALGWERPDVILVTGDTYIDSPQIGVAVIGKYLLKHGFKTAVIAQSSTHTGAEIKRLGEPWLFWGVSTGSIDSMVTNYTATLNQFLDCTETPLTYGTMKPICLTVAGDIQSK